MPKDNRDVRQQIVPPAHVRAQTSRENVRVAQTKIAELQREIERLAGGIPEYIRDTPSSAIEDPIERIEHRQRRTSLQVDSVRDEIGGLRDQIAALSVEVHKMNVSQSVLAGRVDNSDEKVDKLLMAEIEDRKAREIRTQAAREDLERAREAREAKEAEAEIDLKKTGAAYRLKVILALIGLVGTVVTAYLAGLKGAGL